MILGLGASLQVWALLAGADFAALVTASEMAHLVLRVVGAAVLLGLGIRAWWAMWRESRQPDTVGEPVPSPGPRRGVDGVRRGPAGATGQLEGRRPHARGLPAVRAGGRGGVRDDTVLVALGLRVAISSR